MKYKIMEFTAEPKFVGKEIEVVKSTSKGGKSTKQLILELIQRFDKFENKVEKRFDKLENRIDKLENRIDKIVKLNNLKE